MNACVLRLLASVGTDSGTLFDVGGTCVCALAEFPSFIIVLLLCRASVGPSPLSKRRAPLSPLSQHDVLQVFVYVTI
jgi:hypothetical protein